MTEEWRPIPEWEGFYEASSAGRIRSVSRLVRFANRRGTLVERWLTGRVLRPHRNEGRGGYLSVNLSVGSEIVHREVHTLVCEAFHGPRPAGMQAAHNDGDASNAKASNLRWATISENMRDKSLHGTMMCGERHYRAKLSFSAVEDIRSSAAEGRFLARKYGVSPQTISKIRNRQAWRCAA